MNIFGHAFVASKITNKTDRYTAVGSYTNDLVPFVSDSVLTFEEVHEGSEKVLSYLDENFPDKRNFALSMMSHSVKYGADKFNRTIDGWLLGSNKSLEHEIATKICECSGVDHKTAIGPRMHNYLWGGAEVYLIKKEPKFLDDLSKSFENVDTLEIAEILGNTFGKDKVTIQKNLETLLEPVSKFSPEMFGSTEKYVSYWKLFLSGLPEGDNVKISEAVGVLEFIYKAFENRWEEILNQVVSDTNSRITSFLQR